MGLAQHTRSAIRTLYPSASSILTVAIPASGWLKFMNVSWNRTMSPRVPVVFGVRLLNHCWNVWLTVLGSFRLWSMPMTFSAIHRDGADRVMKFAIGACGPAANELMRCMSATICDRSGVRCVW